MPSERWCTRYVPVFWLLRNGRLNGSTKVQSDCFLRFLFFSEQSAAVLGWFVLCCLEKSST
jgi:hypothetical protein